MQVTVKMTVKPWTVPNFVICEMGGRETSISVSEISHSVVQDMAVAWMQDLYKKAGMTPNWRFE